MSEKEAPLHSTSDAFIEIIGKNMLQNDLLLSFLKGKTGLTGVCLPSLDPECIIGANGTKEKHVIMIDCKSIEMENLWEKITSLKNLNGNQYAIALFNVDARANIEKSAMMNGVRGAFYCNDSYEIMPKGISAILNGEFWFTRRALTKFMLEFESLMRPPKNNDVDGLLTSREREILSLISSGLNNKEVSEKLCVSPHTIKTHIYNIYKKINVNNRLQAILWAAKYL